jgi:large subunit ribosomal protein L30
MSSKRLKITLVKSYSGSTERQRETLKGLGLKRVNKTRLIEDTASARGMLAKVSHLVEVKEA